MVPDDLRQIEYAPTPEDFSAVQGIRRRLESNRRARNLADEQIRQADGERKRRERNERIDAWNEVNQENP